MLGAAPCLPRLLIGTHVLPGSSSFYSSTPHSYRLPPLLSLPLPPLLVRAARLAVLVEDQVGTAPCATDVLFPTCGGNIHSFTAISPCAVLDVLAPPYDAEAGRHCTYFREVPWTSSISPRAMSPSHSQYSLYSSHPSGHAGGVPHGPGLGHNAHSASSAHSHHSGHTGAQHMGHSVGHTTGHTLGHTSVHSVAHGPAQGSAQGPAQGTGQGNPNSGSRGVEGSPAGKGSARENGNHCESPLSCYSPLWQSQSRLDSFFLSPRSTPCVVFLCVRRRHSLCFHHPCLHSRREEVALVRSVCRDLEPVCHVTDRLFCPNADARPLSSGVGGRGTPVQDSGGVPAS